MNERKIRLKNQLKRLRESIAKGPSPFRGMNEEQVIEKLRKIRAEVWEEKLASRP